MELELEELIIRLGVVFSRTLPNFIESLLWLIELGFEGLVTRLGIVLLR
jgi:hypothetical protein